MCVIGVLTGLVAFIIDITVKKLFSLKYGVLETGESSWDWERRSSWDRNRRSSWDGDSERGQEIQLGWGQEVSGDRDMSSWDRTVEV